MRIRASVVGAVATAVVVALLPALPAVAGVPHIRNALDTDNRSISNVVATDDRLFFGRFGGVLVTDTQGNSPRTLPVGYVRDLALSPDRGLAYAAVQAPNSIVVIDTATATVVDTYVVDGRCPLSVAPAGAGHLAFSFECSADRNDSVAFLTLTPDGTIDHSIAPNTIPPTGSFWSHKALVRSIPGTDQVLAAGTGVAPSAFAVLSPQDGVVRSANASPFTSDSGCQYLRDMAISPDGLSVVTACPSLDDFERYDLGSLKPVSAYEGAFHQGAAAYSPSGLTFAGGAIGPSQQLFVSDASGGELLYSEGTGVVSERGVTFSPDGRVIYVVERVTNGDGWLSYLRTLPGEGEAAPNRTPYTPENDLPANADGAVSLPFNVVDARVDGATSTAEPTGGPCRLDRSVWYRFQASASGHVEVDARSHSSGFDPSVQLFAGDAPPDALSTPLACNDLADDDPRARLVHPVTAGQTYWVQLGGTQQDGASPLRATLSVRSVEANPIRIAVSGEGAVRSNQYGSLRCTAEASPCVLYERADLPIRLFPGYSPDRAALEWRGCESTPLGNDEAKPGETVCLTDASSSRDVTVRFAPFQTLRVAHTSIEGRGGKLTSEPARIDCLPVCTRIFETGSVVTLSATPNADAAVEWRQGCDSVSGNTCTVALTADRGVEAVFAPRPAAPVTNPAPPPPAPRIASRVTVRTRSPVRVGSRTAVKGKLTYANGAVASGVRLKVVRRVGGVNRVYYPVTNRYGNYTVMVRNTRTGKVKYTVLHRGSSRYAASSAVRYARVIR